MTLTWDAILDLMRAGDSAVLEFHTKLPSEAVLFRSLTSMANADGGKIILGIDRVNFHLVGSDLDVEELKEQVRQSCSPVPDLHIDVFRRGDKNILLIDVMKGNKKPYRYHNNCYLREGARTRLATVDEEHLLRSVPSVPTSSNHESVAVKSPVSAAMGISVLAQDDSQEKVLLVNPIIHQHTEESEPPKSMASMIRVFGQQTAKTSSHELNPRQREAILFLKNHDCIRNKEYRSLYSVSHKTAHLELVDMVNKGHVVSKGLGRSTRYELNQKVMQETLDLH